MMKHYHVCMNKPLAVLKLFRERGYSCAYRADTEQEAYTYQIEEVQEEQFLEDVLTLLQEKKIERILPWEESDVSHCRVCNYAVATLPGQIFSLAPATHCGKSMECYQSLTYEEILIYCEKKIPVLYYTLGGWMEKGWHEFTILSIEQDSLDLECYPYHSRPRCGYEAQLLLRRKEEEHVS